MSPLQAAFQDQLENVLTHPGMYAGSLDELDCLLYGLMMGYDIAMGGNGGNELGIVYAKFSSEPVPKRFRAIWKELTNGNCDPVNE